MGLDMKDTGGFIGAGRPGGKTGNTANVSAPDDATRKARPVSTLGAGQSTGSKGSTDDATRKARPKSSGSGQSTATGPGRTP